MIERVHIVVEGPPGAGKTTFIERLLNSNRARLIAAMRFRSRAGMEEPVEVPGGDDDTERFSRAGAADVGLVHHPRGQPRDTAEFLYLTDVMQGYTHGVVHEVDEEFDIAPDLHVLVFRPVGPYDELWDRLWAAEIGRANLVILNVANAEERAVAEKLAAQIDDLMQEAAVQWSAVRYATGAGRMFKVRIADLMNRKDPELKRALTTVRRKIPPGEPRGSEDLTPDVDEELLQVKITLEGIEPPIWRRILLPADCSFFDLHIAIQNAVGWNDSHRHVFKVDQRGAGEQGVLIGPPDPHGGLEILPGWNEPVLNHLGLGACTRYTYNLFDKWRHLVDVETLRLGDAGVSYPACVAGERACPPEECGGPDSYERLLEALSDPDHEDFGEMTDWCMEHCDGFLEPDTFDPAGVRFEDPLAKLNWAGRR